MNFYRHEATKVSKIISYNITLVTKHLGNGHFAFEMGKGKFLISGAFTLEIRRTNRDVQKLMIRPWYYGGFYIGISCFCDKKFRRSYTPYIWILGVEVWSLGQKSRFFDLRWGPWGVAWYQKFLGQLLIE